ncbi:gliding motility-associated ABC transporter substrate-binding protein GldG [Riemerella anatipestifer]|uniref:gliding motility-associated ABC transporter substrate-binding protein GldG n=1 Tax=Riemerella anatipestifer TaxID=34085 RepID=UPI001374E164|nr:gliding motility-associated ABC transporter substrate-binding protein GldG [Riemerella anatipestifer]
MKKWLQNNIAVIVVGVVALLGVLGIFQTRFDLTEEKRYTLNEATIKTLESVKKPLVIDVYLDGDFPASFKQLQSETKFILEEFRKINPKIDYKFIDPIKTKMSKDTLMAMGMQPSVLPDMKDGKVSEIVLFPYAVMRYADYGTSVPLIIDQVGLDASTQLNKSIENLEYNLISNIKALTTEHRKNIGIIVNHSELKPDAFQGFVDMALENYNIGAIIPEKETGLSATDMPKLKKMDALVVAKPRKPFSDEEKVVLDQYIMNGGKMLWMLDAVNAEMDTLFQAKKIMAYPVDLNLTDFFFNYGIRITPALVKDFKKTAFIRLRAGEIAGNPQYKNFLWPYFPLGISETPHVITKNINPVKLEFPTAIDTLSREGVKKQVLFESSERTSSKAVPNYVDFSEIVNTDSLGAMERPSTPKIFAVSLEGKFRSAYANRSERSSFPNFKSQSPENKMLIIADGDVGRNQILKGEPLPLGVDLLTNQKYGNEQFLRNALDWLLDDSNLMSLRNRNIEARLLDARRIEQERTEWQWFNLLFPLVLIAILSALFYWWRKQKYVK